MGGIAGYIFQVPEAVDITTVTGLWQGIRRRGPDDEGGVFIDRPRREVWPVVSERTQPSVAKGGRYLSPPLPAHDVAFLQSRYALIDPTPRGHQPFRSQDGICIAVFTGSIFNYIELRTELAAQGVPLRTSSDTEVLVEGWRIWKHELWPKLNGTWAAALYDAEENTVTLSRDRLGVAPLYYRETGRGIFFSSLIQPLLEVAPGGYEIDRDVVRGFIDTGLKDHDGTTAYRHVRSLPPATTVTFSCGGEAAFLGADIRPYWELPAKPFTEQSISFAEAVKLVRSTLVDAVSLRLRGDVPFAFELSGGLDSSAVVAAAAESVDRRLRAYTIKVRGRDESRYALATARRFNIDHKVLFDTEADLPQDAEVFARIMEEPYDTPADYIHHLMLRRIKSDGFQVVLTGAGGNEALAGYEASFWPAAWREWRGRGAENLWRADWYEFRRRFMTAREAVRTFMNYFQAAARMAGIKRAEDMDCSPSKAFSYLQAYRSTSYYQQRLFQCRIGLLPYYLRSTDRYTMSIPLESRSPFLDHRLMELGLMLPIPYLFQAGWTKFVLRKAMVSYLPPSVIWRRQKMGFPFVYGNYFHPRRAAFEKYLNSLETHQFRGEGDKGYAELARQDPQRLWRMLSVGIWLAAAGPTKDVSGTETS